MAGKSSEEYWNTSSSASFNFDDDANVFDKTSAGFNELSIDSSNSDSVFGLSLVDNTQSILPIPSIITKRNLDAVLDDVRLPAQTVVPPVQETIIKMFLGMPHVLYAYRSLHQKLELLDEAIASKDGNIILAVVLFLKKSLKLSVFILHLSKRKIALQHYNNYLMRELKLEELADLYMATGNYSDVVYLFYLGQKDTSNKERVYMKLVQYLSEHQSKLNHDKTVLFTDYKRFIKWQLDNNMSSDSITEQLAQICKKEWEKNAESAKSDKQITEFKQFANIGDFQYEWIRLNTLAALKMWNKLTAIFIKPNWLTKRNSIKSVINPELFVSTLHKHDPPKQVLEEFLSCMIDNEANLTLAKKMKCHKFVIDAYIGQKDRLAILTYKECISNQSEEFFYAENALRASDKKWKN